jgi:formylglycine-generating enzyme required for sulfatase activity
MRSIHMWLAAVVLIAGLAASCPAAEQEGDEMPTGDTQTDGMLLIPGGEFEMGDDSRADRRPVHVVRVDSFYMDAREVTNAEYLAFCEETDRGLPEFWGLDRYRSGPDFPDHPVVGVSWYDATAYAEWCGKRLPTEAEWEYAARGGLAGEPYPHGDTLEPANGNYSKSELGGPASVGSYSPNGYGLYDMLGNVCEWVYDRFDRDYYSVSPAENPTGPEEGTHRVIRGGGWHTGPGCMGVYHRNALPGNWLDINVGFRCARDGDAATTSGENAGEGESESPEHR